MAAGHQSEETSLALLHALMKKFLIGTNQLIEKDITEVYEPVGLDVSILVKDINSKKVSDILRAGQNTMEKDGASFFDLIIVTPERRRKKIDATLPHKHIEKIVDTTMPGLHKYYGVVS